MFANKLHAEAYELMLRNQYSAALDVYNSAIEKQLAHSDLPTNLMADLYCDRAFCQLHLQQQEASLQDLDKAILLQPTYAFRYSCRAYVKQLFGDFIGANADYSSALQLDPKEKIALSNRTINEFDSTITLLNPETLRAQFLKTFIEFQKQFPTIEEQKKFLHFLKNGAKNK
jgi:tetratricopeptide (TPR) repeat protein